RLRVFACDHSEESERAADCLTLRREAAKDGLPMQSFFFDPSRGITNWKDLSIHNAIALGEWVLDELAARIAASGGE
ncbi:MAG: hypothetical protein ACOYLF_08825, partial [Blastocatellia bacterium]